MENNLCVGMFGTCGNSTFRKDLFIPKFLQNCVIYYNPQVDDWKPECALEEATHLANDEIILFPVKDETYAVGSLAETGFSILNVIKLDSRRDLVIMITQDLKDELKKDKERAKESLRARALVLEHLKKLNYPNIYIVDSLEEMTQVAIDLYRSRVSTKHLKKYSLKEKFKEN